MINLISKISVYVNEEGNSVKTKKDIAYPVIGTYSRDFIKKSGEVQRQDLFMIMLDDGSIYNVFPSKCKIKRPDNNK